MKILNFLVFCFLSLSAQAEIYKTIDENGNVIYTDTQPKHSDSEEVELKPITPIKHVPKTSYVPSTSQKTKTAKTSKYYEKFKIIEPSNESTIRNKRQFSVQIAIQPRMLSGHKVRLFLDGDVIKTKRGTVFSLDNVERGAHTLKAELIDSKGKVIESTSNTIYVHRATISQ